LQRSINLPLVFPTALTLATDELVMAMTTFTRRDHLPITSPLMTEFAFVRLPSLLLPNHGTGGRDTQLAGFVLKIRTSTASAGMPPPFPSTCACLPLG
jgi:hypothetical protein